MEALAVGLYEGLDDNYLHYRVGQMEYLAAKFTAYPVQALCIELYREAGIRCCGIGSYMLGNDPDTGKRLKTDFGFSRLEIPRRVYTQAHLDVIIDTVIEVKKRASDIRRGFRIVREPLILRHFQAHLEPIR
jgi:tryptophanase